MIRSQYQLPQRDLELTIEEIRKEFTAATTVLKLVEKYQDEGDLKQTRIVERTIQAEHSRAMHRKSVLDLFFFIITPL
jgi:hypothetical protein